MAQRRNALGQFTSGGRRSGSGFSISFRTRWSFNAKRVRKKAEDGSFKSLGRAAAWTRGVAKKSIKVSPTSSLPGSPPHSRRGQIKRSMRYAVERARASAVIGTTRSVMGRIGHTHEFGGPEPAKHLKGRKPNWRIRIGGHGPLRMMGGKPVVGRLLTAGQVARAERLAPEAAATMGPRTIKARRYPKRPFMGPALKRARQRLPAFWKGSVSE